MGGIKEAWKPIEGYEGIYEVSDQGRIRNVKRGGRIMTLSKVTHGYLASNLSKDGKTRSILVHRLVAKAFIPNPDNKPQVNHIDGIKDHNIAPNLEWVTAQENLNHAIQTGLKTDGNGLIVNDSLKKIRERKGWSQKELADVSGLKVSTIITLEGNIRYTRERSVSTIYRLAKALGVSIEAVSGYEPIDE